MNKRNKTIIVLSILTVIFTIIGGTLAYWQWASNNEQKTNVTFTVASGFSCSADGGGSITSNDKQLAPAHCTNSTYAIKRMVKVNVDNNRSDNVYLDMYLNVNSISAGLAGTTNFRYALTTGDDDCYDGLVAEGNFYGATTDTHKSLLSGKTYATTTNNDTYYLWIWLDWVETGNLSQNQNFSFSLAGACTNKAPTTYTGTIYRYSTESIRVGRKVQLRPVQAWCTNSTEEGNSCDEYFYWETESECEAYVADQNMENTVCEQVTVQPISYETNISNINNPFYLKHTVVNDIVTESYVEFIITPAMATTIPGLVAGIYALRGDNADVLYDINESTLLSAFGSSYCEVYHDDEIKQINCNAPGLMAYTSSSSGDVEVDGGNGAYCRAGIFSRCYEQ